MSEHNNGGPAFPVQEFNADGTAANLEVGMTLRDYFAAKVAAAIWSNAETLKTLDAASAGQEIADLAYEQADAMLKAREGS
jgi:type II secretory pathway component PulK